MIITANILLHKYGCCHRVDRACWLYGEAMVLSTSTMHFPCCKRRAPSAAKSVNLKTDRQTERGCVCVCVCVCERERVSERNAVCMHVSACNIRLITLPHTSPQSWIARGFSHHKHSIGAQLGFIIADVGWIDKRYLQRTGYSMYMHGSVSW